MMTAAKPRLALFTSTRADFGLLRLLHDAIREQGTAEAGWFVTGTHLLAEFGGTLREIEDSGGDIWLRLPLEGLGEAPADLCAAAGQLMTGLGRMAGQPRPDAMIILGDRLEALAAATAAFTLGLPVVHIHGGELSLGALDDGYRHAITKLASLHFTAAEPYRRRVLQMGETGDRVFSTGALANDILSSLPPMTHAELEQALGAPVRSPLLLVTLHPETAGGIDPEKSVDTLVSALQALNPGTIIWTYANADAGGQRINGRIAELAGRLDPCLILRPSLGSRLYFNSMRLCDAVVGNSSSGIIEAPLVGVPAVNIGTRQQMRLRASSVVDCGFTADEIVAAVRRCLDPDFRRMAADANSPYAGRDVARTIASRIVAMLPRLGAPKPFVDLPTVPPARHA